MTSYVIGVFIGLILGYLIGFLHSYLKCKNRIIDLYHAVSYLESQMEKEDSSKKGRTKSYE